MPDELFFVRGVVPWSGSRGDELRDFDPWSGHRKGAGPKGNGSGVVVLF